MNNLLQQEMDSQGGHAHRVGVNSITADIERLTETMAMLETHFDSLLGRKDRVLGAIRRSPK